MESAPHSYESASCAEKPIPRNWFSNLHACIHACRQSPPSIRMLQTFWYQSPARTVKEGDMATCCFTGWTYDWHWWRKRVFTDHKPYKGQTWSGVSEGKKLFPPTFSRNEATAGSRRHVCLWNVHSNIRRSDLHMLNIRRKTAQKLGISLNPGTSLQESA